MKKSIYKITNLVNQKIYIGQSVEPFERFKQHCYKKEKYKSLIGEAICKYGKENFSFEIIESDIKNYNEREKYWISYYNCQAPNGYNLTEGGEEPPVHSGLDSIYTTHTIEQVQQVKDLLKNTDLTFEQIGEKTDYDITAIQRINIGKIWNDPDEVYPIRLVFLGKEASHQRWEKVVWFLQNTDLTQKEIAHRCGMKRSAVTMINNGKNGKRWNDGTITYPIRSGRHYNNNL